MRCRGWASSARKGCCGSVDSAGWQIRGSFAGWRKNGGGGLLICLLLSGQRRPPHSPPCVAFHLEQDGPFSIPASSGRSWDGNFQPGSWPGKAAWGPTRGISCKEDPLTPCLGSSPSRINLCTSATDWAAISKEAFDQLAVASVLAWGREDLAQRRPPKAAGGRSQTSGGLRLLCVSCRKPPPLVLLSSGRPSV